MSRNICAELEYRKRSLRDNLGGVAISIVTAALDYNLLPDLAAIKKFRALSADYEKAQNDYAQALYSDYEDETERAQK